MLTNENDVAFWNRTLLIQFAQLKEEANEDNNPALYNQFTLLRELLSALCMDFSSLLWNDKLDKEAIVDCASFLGASIGRKRDRNANMWGLLLYFMLIVTYMFQGGRNELTDIFVWMIDSVTRTTYEFNNHQSLFDQVILAIDKVKNTRASPLNAKEDEVIFWHNYRTNSSPHAPIFNTAGTERYYAFRMDSILAVIKKVLGIHFSLHEVNRAVDESNFAYRGKFQFYCTTSNTWPIANVVLDEATNTSTKVPLLEDDLLPEMMREFKCVFVKMSRFDEIIESVDKATKFDINYENISIKSANKEVGTYNFFECVTGVGNKGWYGYRCLTRCNFAPYCGGTNLINVGGPTTYCDTLIDIEEENVAKGFGELSQMFDPATLREFYGYSFPSVESLPPAYTKIGFRMRNGENDIPIDVHSPPWLDDYYYNGGMGEKDEECSDSPSRSVTPTRDLNYGSPSSQSMFSAEKHSVSVDDEQTNEADGPSTYPFQARSNPLADVTKGLINNSPDGPKNRPLKRRRASNRFILDEAEDDDDEDDDEDDDVSLPLIKLV